MRVGLFILVVLGVVEVGRADTLVGAELLDQTVSDMHNASKKSTKQIQNSSANSIIDSVFTLVDSILASVAHFLKSIFGDDSPQPAIPPTAGLPESMPSSRWTEKAMYLSAIGMLSWLAWLSCQQNKKQLAPQGYAPIGGTLDENFL